jgi:hypothetical protein
VISGKEKRRWRRLEARVLSRKGSMKNRVAQLLEKHKDEVWSGGLRCGTCSHPRVKKIDADCLDFIEIKKTRAPGFGMPWSAFVELAIRKPYGYKLTTNALLKHLRKCRKIEVLV